MKKTIVVVFACIAVVVGVLYIYATILQRKYDKFGKWETVSRGKDGQLPWINFYWNTDSAGNKWAMFVPVRMANLPHQFGCQFDIGANLSMIYGNTLQPFSERYPDLKSKLSTDIIRKDTIPYLSDLQLQIDSISFTSQAVVIRKDFGDLPTPDSGFTYTAEHALKSGTIIGTIGADICKSKVLVIDYPRNRLCIVDEVPIEYQTPYSDITLDNQGRPVLGMEYKGKHYKIGFDCGSSIFPILVLQQTMAEFSTAPVTDTIPISSWGKMVNMVGRPMKDSFTLAGHRYGNVKIYTSEDAGKENIPYGWDGLTGNILFLNKVLIIDFKHKKMGLM